MRESKGVVSINIIKSRNKKQTENDKTGMTGGSGTTFIKEKQTYRQDRV